MRERAEEEEDGACLIQIHGPSVFQGFAETAPPPIGQHFPGDSATAACQQQGWDDLDKFFLGPVERVSWAACPLSGPEREEGMTLRALNNRRSKSSANRRRAACE
jgi:hypothetical protein